MRGRGLLRLLRASHTNIVSLISVTTARLMLPIHLLRDPDTDTVFIRFGKAFVRLSADQVRELSLVARRVQKDNLAILDSHQHIQACFRKDVLDSALAFHFDVSKTACLGSTLAELLGPVKKEKRRSDGFVDVFLSHSFDDPALCAQDVFSKVVSLLQRGWGVSEPSASYAVDRSANIPVNRLIDIRKQLRERIEMLDSETWGRWRDVTNNPAAALAKYREQKRVFAVREGRIYLYPRFQFDTYGAPLPAMAQLLEVIPGDAQGWPLLSWLDASNRRLGGRRPREVIAQEPTAVVEAARDFYEGD